ncbi:hypothetical protein PAJ34TS1_30920 [Paenibacillus azoreducens]|uniref:Uncharacterized protein n=1 Tax=Paenibacillus azoreducens TaxID=116718 RepID=A0A919YD42_9BACL|nr:hypothetical protein J34TS1_17780 [Paenibacillus azoreducens]
MGRVILIKISEECMGFSDWSQIVSKAPKSQISKEAKHYENHCYQYIRSRSRQGIGVLYKNAGLCKKA